MGWGRGKCLSFLRKSLLNPDLRPHHLQGQVGVLSPRQNVKTAGQLKELTEETGPCLRSQHLGPEAQAERREVQGHA